MSEQRYECWHCKAHIAVERGLVRKRIQATASGTITTVYDTGVTVQCRVCGRRRFVLYPAKQKAA